MAQSFLPNQVQAFAQDPDVTKALRRQQLAEALLQESAVPINPNRPAGRFQASVSPIEGLAKMLQAGLGAYQLKKAEGDLSTVERSRRDALVKELRKGQTPEPLGGEEFDIDSQIAPPVSPYANAFDRPVSNRIDLTTAQVQAPKVNVMGSYRQPEEPKELSAIDKYRLRIADQLDAGNMTRQEALSQLNSLEQMMLVRELDMDKPTAIPEGGRLVTPRGKVLAEGKEKYRAPMKVTSGAGVDAQGRPLEVDKLIFPGSTSAVDIEGIKPTTKGPLATANASVSTKDPFKAERDLRKDFKDEPIYKAHQEVKSAFSQIQGALKQGTAISDVAAATKIMKLLDPGSVVRESELGIAMAASGLMDRVMNYATRIATGQVLTPNQRKEFGKLAEEFYKFSEDQFNASALEHRSIASDYGLNPNRVAPQPKGQSGTQGNEGYRIKRP